MNRGRNDGMRSRMDGYNKIQRHKGRRERNGWVKLRVGKWWNEASLSSIFNYFKIAIIITLCTNPGPHEIIHHYNPAQNLLRHITKRLFSPSPIVVLFALTQQMHT